MFDSLDPVDGSRLLTEAQRRVASWLSNEPTIKLLEAPERLAVDAVNLVIEVLNGRHVLVLKPTGWRLEHDLRCRLGVARGCPFEGPLRVWLNEVGGPPKPPGRYLLGLDGKRKGQNTPITLLAEKDAG
jgi:hypothetical protein